MKLKRLANYFDGRFEAPAAASWLDVENPASGQRIAQVPLSEPSLVDRAVQAATVAFPAWCRTPVAQRAQAMFRLAASLRENGETISRVLVEEMGKSLPDARAELKRTIENVEVACGVPTLQQGEVLVGASPGIDGEVLRLPIGVFGVIAPFNFPAMVPFWFVPTAIATGNTVVVKASEQVPCTMSLIAELIDAVGLPPGVFNLIHGDAQTAQAIVEHPAVAGICFVGSTAVGQSVSRRCAELGKRCQAMGGAKNHLLVMPDARLDEAIRNMVSSCFGCAGQRCMAASAIVAIGEPLHQEVTARFVEAAKGLAVGDPLDPKHREHAMLMGPVISASAQQRIESLIQIGLAEGATLRLDGRGLRVPGAEAGHYLGPTVFCDVQPGMEIHRTEIFGPVVVILMAKDFNAAMQIINGHRYGNGASIYTQSGYWARRFKLEVQAGMVGVNVGIPAPVAQLPFGGSKASMLSPIKTQGADGIDFFTERKIVTTRFHPCDEDELATKARR